MEKIKITIEGVKEEPIVTEVNRFALVTFTDEGIERHLCGVDFKDLSVAANVLQIIVLRDLLFNELKKVLD
jgi:hypothetical protein